MKQSEHSVLTVDHNRRVIPVVIYCLHAVFAFDTIQRDQLIDIAKDIFNEDEIRILTVFLAETILEFKEENAQTPTFESKIVSPQEDSISGTLFTIYINHALQQLREEIEKEPLDVRDINAQWTERMKSNLPEEIVHADD